MNIIQTREEYVGNLGGGDLKLLESCSPNHFKELKTFHPSGKDCPDTNYIHKGYFYGESDKNRNSFIINEKIHGEQYGLKNYRGGMIVFSTDVNSVELSKNRIINRIKQFLVTLKNRYSRTSMIDRIIRKFNGDETKLVDEKIYSYTVGNFFNGRYLSDDGHTFDEKSTSVEVNGLTTSGLLMLAEFISKSFKQETVLVKDFNKNKIYLADSEKFEGSLEDLEKELDEINVDC